MSTSSFAAKKMSAGRCIAQLHLWVISLSNTTWDTRVSLAPPFID